MNNEQKSCERQHEEKRERKEEREVGGAAFYKQRFGNHASVAAAGWRQSTYPQVSGQRAIGQRSGQNDDKVAKRGSLLFNKRVKPGGRGWMGN